jgi:hypothetical protein
MTTQGKIRLFACGGFGTNIGAFFDRQDLSTPGYSQIHPAYLDTSRSNLNKAGVSQENTFILEDKDGSGGVRKENHGDIAKNVPGVLQKFPPLDFNIVAFSAGGGSGSVFGPLVLSELLSRGLPAVAIVVGGDESTIRAENTLKSLKSLEGIAKARGLPVVMYYRQNDANTRRSEIDADCHAVIACLSLLNSKQNDELDSKDIENWVQFTKTTSAGARLARLLVTDNLGADEVADPIAIASLLSSPDDPSYKTVPEYSTVGYPAALAHKDTLLPKHLVITFEGIPAISKRLLSRIDELEGQRNARVDHAALVRDGEADSSGMVL